MEIPTLSAGRNCFFPSRIVCMLAFVNTTEIEKPMMYSTPKPPSTSAITSSLPSQLPATSLTASTVPGSLEPEVEDMQISEPMIPTYSPGKNLVGQQLYLFIDELSSEMGKYLCYFKGHNDLGIINHFHEYYLAASPLKGRDPTALKLALLHSKSVVRDIQRLIPQRMQPNKERLYHFLKSIGKRLPPHPIISRITERNMLR